MPTDLSRVRREAGFTLVELMVAALVLLLGLGGAVTILTGAIRTSSANNERVAATNLARELIENSRTVNYDLLTPTAITAAIQAQPNMGGMSGGVWKIQRRGTVFTISPSVCTYDDPADKLASPAPDNVCTPQPAGTTSTKENGDDFRRVTFAISWRDQGITRTLNQTALIVNPSGGLGPRITSYPSPAAIVSSTATSVTLYVDTTTLAATVHWNSDDGSSQGDVNTYTTPQAGTRRWTFTWNLGTAGQTGSVLDGTYQLAAQAFDDRGVAGDAKVATVVINRVPPLAPAAFAGGHDTRLTDILDFDWNRNRERDIVGYRLYWEGANGAIGGGDDVRKCPPTTATTTYLDASVTSCSVTSPPPGAGKYYLVALDRDASGNLREGAATEVGVNASGSRPNPPLGPLQASIVNGVPTLTWNAPGSGNVLFYRIYRDTGTTYADRWDRTASNTTAWSDPAPGPSTQHKYWVTAVDSSYNESDPLGPVTSP